MTKRLCKQCDKPAEKWRKLCAECEEQEMNQRIQSAARERRRRYAHELLFDSGDEQVEPVIRLLEAAKTKAA